MKPLNLTSNTTRSTKLLAFLCLVLTALLTIPCSAIAAPSSTAKISHHCDTCCPSSPSTLANACCTTAPQPAQTVSPHASTTTRTPTFAALHPALDSVLTAPTRTILKPPAPSPPLHPILRI